MTNWFSQIGVTPGGRSKIARLLEMHRNARSKKNDENEEDLVLSGSAFPVTEEWSSWVWVVKPKNFFFPLSESGLYGNCALWVGGGGRLFFFLQE